jgi:hypothetical protein
MAESHRGGCCLVWMARYVLVGVSVEQAVFDNQGLVFGFEVGKHVSGMVPDNGAIHKIRFHRGGAIAEEHRIGGSAADEKAVRAVGIAGVDIAWGECLVNMGIVQGSRWSDIAEHRV